MFAVKRRTPVRNRLSFAQSLRGRSEPAQSINVSVINVCREVVLDNLFSAVVVSLWPIRVVGSCTSLLKGVVSSDVV